MKQRIFLSLLAVALLAAGCGKKAEAEILPPEPPATTLAAEAPTQEETLPPETQPPETQAPSEEEVIARCQQIYQEPLDRYYTALREQWDAEMYFENNMSELPHYYYDGDPLENVGFCFPDLDQDGCRELVIGAIYNAQLDPAVFEIWTLREGQPVMLAQGFSRNRYILQYVPEDNMWYVVNEGSNSAFNNATLCMMLQDGAFQVVQGITLDGFADPENPWFLTYDQDWDVSNDIPIDEETAMAILDSIRAHYTALEYIPFRNY